MTRDETIALFRECDAKRTEARKAAMAAGKSEKEADKIAHEAAKAHWNAWAEALLAERKEMEEAGTWATEPIANDKTREWMNRAAVDLSGCVIKVSGFGGHDIIGEVEEESAPIVKDAKSLQLEADIIDFSGFVFPGDAIFDIASFSGPAYFISATFSGDASFDSASFSGDAFFESATLSGDAIFESATFSGIASFKSATFSGDAIFDIASFSGPASFDSASFSGPASFDSATFSGRAIFNRATFSGPAFFDSATFSGIASFESATFSGDAFFESTTFNNATTFQEATFGTRDKPAEVNFIGARIERAFDLTRAQFSKVPAFNQANFAEGPDLDDVFYPHPPFWRFGLASKNIADKNQKAEAAKYRHLRRLAILGHDHENEAKAFKGEVRARRGIEEKPWHAAWWFGMIYDLLSDFGRSMMRPFYGWVGMTAGFALLYLALSDVTPDRLTQTAPTSHRLQAQAAPAAPAERLGGWFSRQWNRTCANGEGNPLTDAVYLSVKNGLLVIGWESSGKLNQVHACLFGGNDALPRIPSRIAMLELLQNVLSAALIFLFLLGVRNRFKIK